jgi:hypothetical protein
VWPQSIGTSLSADLPIRSAPLLADGSMLRVELRVLQILDAEPPAFDDEEVRNTRRRLVLRLLEAQSHVDQ